MVKNFDDFQKLGKDNVDVAMKSFGAMSKGWQTLAAEMTEYSKKAFEGGTAAFEKLAGAKSMEKAVEIQTAYAKSAYEDFMAQTTKVSEIFADMAKESYKSFEAMMPKAASAK